MRGNAKSYDRLREYLEKVPLVDCHDHTATCGPQYTDPISVVASGFTTRISGICRLIKVLMSVFHREQSPYLLVGNHLKSPDLRNFK